MTYNYVNGEWVLSNSSNQNSWQNEQSSDSFWDVVEEINDEINIDSITINGTAIQGMIADYVDIKQY